MVFSLLDWDVFGSAIGFKHDTYYTRKSYFGLVLTIILTLISIFFATFYSNQYISNSDLNLTDLSKRYGKTQNITTNNTLVYAFGYDLKNAIADANISISDIGKKLINIHSLYIRVINNEIVEQTPLSLIECSTMNWNQTINDFTLKNAFCFNNSDLVLFGNQMSADFSYIQTSFYYNFEGIDTDLSSNLLKDINSIVVSINFHMIDTIYSVTDKFQGAIRTIKTVKLKMMTSLSTDCDIYISVNSLRSLKRDVLFYETFWNEYNFAFDFTSSMFSLITPGDTKAALTVNVLASDSSKHAIIKKKTISEYLAQLSGIINFTILSFGVISNTYNCYYFQYKKINNEITIIEDNKNENNKKERILNDNAVIYNLFDKTDGPSLVRAKSIELKMNENFNKSTRIGFANRKFKPKKHFDLLSINSVDNNKLNSNNLSNQKEISKNISSKNQQHYNFMGQIKNINNKKIEYYSENVIEDNAHNAQSPIRVKDKYNLESSSRKNLNSLSINKKNKVKNIENGQQKNDLFNFNSIKNLIGNNYNKKIISDVEFIFENSIEKSHNFQNNTYRQMSENNKEELYNRILQNSRNDKNQESLKCLKSISTKLFNGNQGSLNKSEPFENENDLEYLGLHCNERKITFFNFLCLKLLPFVSRIYVKIVSKKLIGSVLVL